MAEAPQYRWHIWQERIWTGRPGLWRTARTNAAEINEEWLVTWPSKFTTWQSAMNFVNSQITDMKISNR
jgi:hypothetical protein